MVNVHSSALRSFVYDNKNNELIVTFPKGETYVYSDVPREVYLNWKKAESKGQYFHVYIKGVYDYTVVHDE